MKKFISLFLITLIAAMSWPSCADNKMANVTTTYTLSSPIAEYSLLSPLLTEKETNDSLLFPQDNTVNVHNRFFELSIIFNEKLQQLLSKLRRTNNEKSDIVKNTIPTNIESQSVAKDCKTRA